MEEKFEPMRKEMTLPKKMEDPDTWKRIALFQFIYSLCGLLPGLICILGGIILLLNGIVGSTRWTAKIFGTESDISDAAPGAILFIVGLFFVLITRFSAKSQK